MRTADDPGRQRDEPELDSPLEAFHAGAGLRALGLVLLLFALGGLPLVMPDLRSGHYVYLLVVGVVAVVALLVLELGAWLRARAVR